VENAGSAGAGGGGYRTPETGGIGGAASLAGEPGTSQAGSGGQAACGGAKSTSQGRPVAVACTPVPADLTPDAGSLSCSTDADCAAIDAFEHCFHGKCGADQCLSDTDCSNGDVCRCWTDQRGNAIFGNSCVPAGCRVDADCGPGGSCSPTFGNPCRTVTGYQCHSAADTCHSNGDCCGDTPVCDYQPELGHFACQAITVCNG